MRKAWLLAVLLLAFTLGACANKNHPPVIQTFSASSNQVFVGTEVALHIEASDPENHPLTFSWSTDEGSFTSVRGQNAVWTSNVPGLHNVDVEVADPYGGSVKARIELRVDDHVLLPAGSKVRTELLHDVRGDSVRIGDLVPLRVVDAVYAQGFEAIPRNAFGVGQVLYVQLPVNGSGGYMVLAPSRVQLSDGRIVSVSGVRDLSALGTGKEADNGALSLTGTFFTFTAEESVVVRSGAQLEGVIRDDLPLRIHGDQIQPSNDAQHSPVAIRACLGIHGSDFSEYVISVYSEGVRVEGFESDTSAAHSGIQVGDRITGIRVGSEEYPIANVADLNRVERTLNPGDQVSVLVRNVLRRADIPLTANACYVVN